MESGLISVDRWKSGSQAYFLTHMHSDHTRGLSPNWSHATLFCSRTISWPSTPTTAPVYFGCFLYTGDFRWECEDAAAEEARTTLVAAVNDFPVDILYCNPVYTFPSLHVAANLIAHIILSHPSHDIVIGVDSLGKEHLLVHHAPPCFSIQTLEGLNLMCPTIGIMPSGLPWLKTPFKGDANLSGSLLTANNRRKPAAQQRELLLLQGAVHMFHDNMFSVNYSDHSCYQEIGEFINLVKPKSLKGIVVSSSCYVDPLYYFGRVCGASEPPELLLLRPDSTEQFRAVRIKSYSTKDETINSQKEKWRKGDGHSSLRRNKKRREHVYKLSAPKFQMFISITWGSG
ncbi:hypothetical protein Bca52824_074207 [Brassica carinata]|uniref:DNA repair metallo-beta-lactamase domain-containing protein n=1 Tax=Brassica carinata TaxID=52824 RepID=A0A8X7QBZ4_BRACI|nr:hypothetical protein Bca52824_074207 [Brassica carinata]